MDILYNCETSDGVFFNMKTCAMTKLNINRSKNKRVYYKINYNLNCKWNDVKHIDDRIPNLYKASKPSWVGNVINLTHKFCVLWGININKGGFGGVECCFL